MKEVKLVRTLHNQLIIGRVTETSHIVTILNPYTVMPTGDGLEMYPLDLAIVGKDIEKITLDKSALLYWVIPGIELVDSYIKARTGIDLKKEIII